MALPETPQGQDMPEPHDPVEQVVSVIPVVLPVVGAALMFLLAWIAIYMA